MKKARPIPDAVAGVLRRDIETLRALVAAGTNVNEPDGDGRTALHHAAIGGDLDATTFLLDAGARVDAPDSAGWTALHFAARGHFVAVAEALLGRGAEVDPEDEYGNTPLFRAVFESKGRGEMIQLLRAHGADPARHNKHGVSPADLARRIANYDLSRWL